MPLQQVDCLLTQLPDQGGSRSPEGRYPARRPHEHCPPHLCPSLFTDGFQNADAGSGTHVYDRTAVGNTIEGAFDRNQVLLSETGQWIIREANVCSGFAIGRLSIIVSNSYFCIYPPHGRKVIPVHQRGSCHQRPVCTQRVLFELAAFRGFPEILQPMIFHKAVCTQRVLFE